MSRQSSQCGGAYVSSIAKNTRCRGKQEFLTLLSEWYTDTDEATIGGAARGQTAWVHFEASGVECYLNADTKRAAVERLLKAAREEDAVWRVVSNRDGKVNKVSVEPGGEKTPGLYLYTKQEQVAGTTL